jgi:hypothetical protein
MLMNNKIKLKINKIKIDIILNNHDLYNLINKSLLIRKSISFFHICLNIFIS